VNAIQLSLAGVKNIWTAGECTFCNPDRYFSFRREKEQAGRMTSFIGSRGAENTW
jgi:copper oxidase (laccase) domain-containing protein